MSRVRDVNERVPYSVADTESFDAEGYCISPAGDGDLVQKSQAPDDVFLGVNHKSSYDQFDETVESGGGPRPQRDSDGMGGMAVEQDGVVMMQCEAGSVYSLGDPVYLSSTAGVANLADDDSGTAGGDTQVGTVYKEFDLSGETGTALVAVNITGHI